ncbi:Protein CBG27991 [Caenorhabditis briggsae]|uniref:Protein CBG27991 n=1 Tax=Caenorhabditis briggsae TaxID=6238 RepID=B6IM52_CAEBR|nr:Protein CBG27991 [Caenorhabditis briggsae]CAS00982.1 Protein CBG27991 [Caenorhabditis briggsae]
MIAFKRVTDSTPPDTPSHTSIRWLCKIDGCNLPKGFITFFDLNNLPIPETFF